MDTKLYLEFENAEGDLMRMSINNPREDLSDTEISAAMGNIVSSGVFTLKGTDLVNPKAAYKIEQTRTDYIEGE